MREGTPHHSEADEFMLDVVLNIKFLQFQLDAAVWLRGVAVGSNSNCIRTHLFDTRCLSGDRIAPALSDLEGSS